MVGGKGGGNVGCGGGVLSCQDSVLSWFTLIIISDSYYFYHFIDEIIGTL